MNSFGLNSTGGELLASKLGCKGHDGGVSEVVLGVW